MPYTSTGDLCGLAMGVHIEYGWAHDGYNTFMDIIGISYGYYMLCGYYNTFIWINLEVKILGNVSFRTKPGRKLMTTDGGNTYKVSPHLVNVWVDQVDNGTRKSRSVGTFPLIHGNTYSPWRRYFCVCYLQLVKIQEKHGF